MAQISAELPWHVEAMLLCMANGTWLPPTPPEPPWLAATRAAAHMVGLIKRQEDKGEHE